MEGIIGNLIMVTFEEKGFGTIQKGKKGKEMEKR